MVVPLNTELYNSIKEEAKQKYKRYPSIYSSMWITKEYKKRGGTYKDGDKNKGTRKWLREKWVAVSKYLEGEEVKCGDYRMRDKQACRPLLRIDDKTPITIPELIKLHGRDKLKKIAKKKENNMELRINWKSG